MGNGIINIKIKLYFGEKASFKMLINDGKILEDQLHFVQRPENENGLFTVQILRKCQREINTPWKGIPISSVLKFKSLE